MKAIILVGGEGTRLRPLTTAIPKPMLPVVNRPFIEHVIIGLAECGIDEVILSAGYKPQVFDSHLGDGSDFGIKISYVTEEAPLGTGGAAKNASGRIDDTFMVLNGDILSGVDYPALIEFHKNNKAAATLTLTRVEDPTQYGLVTLNENARVTGFTEKPGWNEVTTDLVNAGIYILEPSVMAGCEQGRLCSFERQIFPGLLENKEPVFGFVTDAYWLDIGTPAKYLQAHHDILMGKMQVAIDGKKNAGGVWIGDSTEIDPKADVIGPSIVGAGTKVGSGAIVRGLTTIGPGCVIGEGAVLDGCVLHEGVFAGAGAEIKDSIVAAGIHIAAGCKIDSGTILI